jgi:hypothetical protein
MESNQIARKPMDRGASSIQQEKQSKTVLQELCNCSLEGGNEKREEQEQDGSKRGDLRVTDVDMDSLVLCASNLDLHDLVNMAMTCHRFRDAAYSDTVWEIQCRKRWPLKQMCDGGTFQYSGGRDAYVARHTFSQQLRYTDPTDAHLHLLPMPINHLLLDNDTVTIAQVQFSYTIDLSDWKRIYLVCTPNGMGVLVAKSWVLCAITAGSNNNSMEGRANSRGTHGGTQCHPCSP